MEKHLQLPAYSRELYRQGLTGIVHEERQRFLSHALFFLRCNNFWGNYLEFGVYQAWTFRQAMLTAESFGMTGLVFYAFDSFMGLPETRSLDYSARWGFESEVGTRAMSEAEFLEIIEEDIPQMARQVRTVPGFFDRSLTPQCRDDVRADCAANNMRKDGRVALVNIDCDLYESAVPIFPFIEDLIDQGSVIYMDDYWVGYGGSPAEGVARAFREYREQSRFDFVDWGRIGGWGHAFVAQAR
ncbi:MAG: hypothetical protein JO339_22070 [Alphaproteobacteria bacterium]|nr:hypothetical protein [Alphaproteobacteria bacterium]